jgi:cysteine dioxygenase
MDILNQIDYTPHIQFDDVKYKRIPIFQTLEYEVILICWKAGQKTAIHDHPEIGCTLKVCEGRLLETDYSPETLEIVATRTLSVGSVGFKQGSNPLHSILALEDSVSLHLYQPSHYVPKIYVSGKKLKVHKE